MKFFDKKPIETANVNAENSEVNKPLTDEQLRVIKTYCTRLSADDEFTKILNDRMSYESGLCFLLDTCILEMDAIATRNMKTFSQPQGNLEYPDNVKPKNANEAIASIQMKFPSYNIDQVLTKAQQMYPECFANPLYGKGGR